MSLKETIKSFTPERWDIGVVTNDMQSILNGDELHVDWIKHHFKDSWFADPFVLDVTDEQLIILAEEFFRPTGLGRISKLTVDRKSLEIVEVKVLLDLDTHLSFPAIKRVGDAVYIYPENGEAGGLWEYHYDTLTDELSDRRLICEEPVSDAVQFTVDNRQLMFATRRPTPNNNVLSVYELNEETGKYDEIETRAFDENIARSAGDFILFGGKIYRPAQECNVQYGHAVVVQQVDYCNGKFVFNEIRRMTSIHPKLKTGMHTLNTYKGVIVTDALGFENNWIRQVLKFFKLM